VKSSTQGLPSAQELRSWGLDPDWSRSVTVAGRDGGEHRWHVLDRPGTDPDAPTVVCVHGNPTWSVLWSGVLAGLDPTYRVVAPDQLGMGFSERVPRRRYAERVDDLDAFLDAMGIAGPVVLMAQDWGGAIAMGWAVRHRERVRAMVLSNTGIAVPAGRRAPGLIRIAASPVVADLVTRRSSLFLRGTPWLPGVRLSSKMREALAAPYRRAADRDAIAGFVADVPLRPDHPSAAAIAAVAAGVTELEIPVLLAWGSKDPVFNEDFADDLLARLGQAELHRFGDAGHLLPLEVDLAGLAQQWLGDQLGPAGRRIEVTTDQVPRRPLWWHLDDRRADTAIAFHDGASGRSVTFAELAQMVDRIAGNLIRRGVEPGDRVAVLVPPSVELMALVYGCWRIGAVTVIADRGLGLRGLSRAIGGARPAHLVGPRSALTAAAVLRWAPRAKRWLIDELTARTDVPLDGDALGDGPEAEAPAAVLFTSGATGPAKGVRYTHGRLEAQRDALNRSYDITAEDRLVAAFAPFALFGPALGITSAIPDVDVTSPGKLTASALNQACAAVHATMVFASPAALANVIATAVSPRDLEALAKVRIVMSAGAPVPVATLRSMRELVPAATLHTPYGMTESLPVADVDLVVLEEVGCGRGVCVGAAVPGGEVMIVPLGFDAAEAVVELPCGVTGEVLVRSPWMSAGYDRAWTVQRAARPVDSAGRIWHRSGDVGHVDAQARLWIEGRSVHVIHAVHGPVTPVPVEVRVEQVPGVRRVAAVGVGPRGVQELVVVVETEDSVGARRSPMPGVATPRIGLASVPFSEQVRAAVAPLPVAAVCLTSALPVDIRHNAKIDRAAVAEQMERFLSGAGS
jgi:acyl-coenzyme A synthetase/AMP-(fatty) acid ligase/pimeloyl-ACP methyl ester carboxylesterase